ncbi:MAG: 5'-3' exonuclease H3TH domain-containing protein, partial [Alphaproteobacteria bacterium]
MEKFGVPPEKVIDVQSLAGDSVDNVPGVPGIGIKTAAELINEFGDLDKLLAKAETIKQPKRRESLIANADAARLSRQLVTLRTDVPVEHELSDFAVQEPEPQTLIGFLKGLEFNALLKRVAAATGVEDVGEIAAAPIAAGKTSAGPKSEAVAKGQAEGGGAPGAILRESEVRAALDTRRYETVLTLEALDPWIAAAQEEGLVAIDVRSTADAMRGDIVGIALAVQPQRAAYLPLGHGHGSGLDLDGAQTPKQIPLRAALDRLAPLLEDPG